MNNTKAPILYLSYDGMTDPLGQSQVLPYIIGLTKKGYSFHLISFEKEEKFALYKDIIQAICDENNIVWYPQKYHKKPPIISTLRDLKTMQKVADKLHKTQAFQLVHCRSYISAFVGLNFKRKKKAKFLFDMRGFWADERVDGDLWKLSNPIYKTVYNFFKKKERAFLSEADGVVSLTENGKKEMLTWNIPHLTADKITVIPCAADFDVFTLKTPESHLAAKKALDISENTFVVSYLGSLGAWYLLDEMLFFFKKVKEQKNNAKFLILTGEAHVVTDDKLSQFGLTRQDIILTFSPRDKIASFMHASDINISFIKSSFAKKASSPTKMGETLAMGIPIICNNSNVGDVTELMNQLDCGLALNDYSEKAIQEVVNNLDTLCAISPLKIRNSAYEFYSLINNVDKYETLYKQLI